MTRTVTKLEKKTGFGYTLVASFIMDKYDQGGVTYELRMIEDWGDHICYPRRSYRKFPDKNIGNRCYKSMLRDGYVFVEKDTFVPTEMDNR